jgi:hypothetical protein
MTRRLLPLVPALALLLTPGPAGADEPVSFRNEVMAVLSRAGCNQGTCHGNLNGKGGFRLSLRGFDPAFDFASLTRDALGRRTDRHRPDESLILQKPTGRVPHEGGQRFAVASPEYDILRRWIAEGLRPDPPGTPVLVRLEVSPAELYVVQPACEVTVKVRAVFSDGSGKDVSGLAVFESTNPKVEVSRLGLVRAAEPAETTVVVRYLNRQGTALLAFVPARPGFVWADPPAASFVDEHVFARLKKLRINPSGLCTDTEFVRRAYLDLLGILPTPAETKAFLADPRADKRARLVDALLDRPEFADFWALHWADLLRIEEKQLDRKGVRLFHAWVRDAIAHDKPLNQFARELIAAQGSTYAEPVANYYRALRDPQTRAEATAQVFLGVRMQCAKCHNHPFNQWTQNDYHQLAAFFPRVQYKVLENRRKDDLDKHEFIGEQIVLQDDLSEIVHPVTGAELRPKFLGGAEPDLGPDGDRLRAMAEWVARPDNPFFARTQANRIWAQLLGRGIVDPTDDFRQSNPPANGPLLEALARDLAGHGFDLKHLIRRVMTSRTYQLSAVPNDTNREDETNFSHALVRPLPAESLLDAISQVTDVPAKFEGYPVGLRATQLPGLPAVRRKSADGDGVKFLRLFGKPERLLSCDCERSTDTTLAQALQLITGSLLNEAVGDPDNRLGQLLKAGRSNREIIEELFFAALCRPPNPSEQGALVARVDASPDRRGALEDVLWALLNSKEFMLRK